MSQQEEATRGRIEHEGIYSIVRHPLYSGNFIASLGAFLFCALWCAVHLCRSIFVAL